MRSACLFVMAVLAFAGCTTSPGVQGPGSYFVSSDVADVRLGASWSARITNRIYRQQRVDVFEVSGPWARVSKYYDGSVEGAKSPVARWVPVFKLSAKRPPDLKQPSRPRDPRINGMPKVGEDGLTRRDVDILYRGAAHYLQSGHCKKIEFGDKSTSRRDTYYVYCGGPANIFFTEKDLPRGQASR